MAYHLRPEPSGAVWRRPCAHRRPGPTGAARCPENAAITRTPLNRPTGPASFRLRANERLLFEGDATHLVSNLSHEETRIVVSDQRLFIARRDVTIERSTIASYEQRRAGFNPKAVFRLHDGGRVALIVVNRKAFAAAVDILLGKASPDSMPAPPALDRVRMLTAWIAALGPALGLLGGRAAAAMMGSEGPHALRVVVYWLILTWLQLKNDQVALQRQGFDPQRLGLVNPAWAPVYLFSRARIFGRGTAAALLWCVLALGSVQWWLL